VAHGSVAEIPYLGSGLGYRSEIGQSIFARLDEIDFVEVIPEQFLTSTAGLGELERVAEALQVIPHSVSLSVGSAAPPDRDFLRGIKRVCEITRPPYYSEHLCVSRVPGIDIGQLSPLWFTEEVLEVCIANVSAVQDYLGMPLVLENVNYVVEVPGSHMPQTEFFNRLVAATGCGVLLDVTNVYINSVNHDFDPAQFLLEMPLDRVVQVHLAGGYWADGWMIDSHSGPVHEASWKLLDLLVSRAPVKGVILEHDQDYPDDFSELTRQVNRARDLLRHGRPEQAPVSA
jgi:uncharacterized protein (UPF0276 family)